MKILALDLSTNACSVAVLADGELSQRLEPGQRPSRQVLQLTDELLHAQGLSLGDIEAVAFGHGPGAFTGLRIAAGVAQGIALGRDIPVLGISSLQALAQVALDRHAVDHVAVALDARMDEIYVGRYRRAGDDLAEPLEDDALMPPDAWETPDPVPALLAGNGWSAYAGLRQRLSELQCDDSLLPEAAAIAKLALPRLAAGEGGPPESAIPVYLRDKVAWKSG
ncbi:MAG: tRNA (adenosine(37)-N6)-threonylcarbamoyltransferase complex dimerization subunit type 1 TsaB [Gammaproteobacteria bacterium]|nr:tRNA (adenosine(37)-N6)-threonylcarbamoyltransferase complex dimerization subunit type 1 TsaB [Gammaproteobacteria bacterium]